MLIYYAEQRWLSSVICVERFYSMTPVHFELIYKELHLNVQYKNSLDNIKNNVPIIQAYLEVMGNLKPAIKTLEGEKVPTISKVMEVFNDLKNHFKEKSEMNCWIRHALGVSASKIIEYQIEKFLGDVHILGGLLDPLTKDNIYKILGKERSLEVKKIP